MGEDFIALLYNVGMFHVISIAFQRGKRGSLEGNHDQEDGM